MEDKKTFTKDGKETVHYVDKKEFYRLIVERKGLLVDTPDLPISDAMGQMIIDIASNLTFHRFFIKYPYRDELIGDAIENCIRYFDNFNIEKSKNPFAYFTQISWFAFLRRIKKEYKLDDIKDNLKNKDFDYGTPFSVQDQDLYDKYPNPSTDFMTNDDIFVTQDEKAPDE